MICAAAFRRIDTKLPLDACSHMPENVKRPEPNSAKKTDYFVTFMFFPYEISLNEKKKLEEKNTQRWYLSVCVRVHSLTSTHCSNELITN